MDPHTGRVLAISGGFSFEISQFDRATQAKRQPGSSIKPFVYLTALDHGFTPSTLVVDGPISLPQGPGMPMWSPTNYARRNHEARFRGPTPLRVALEQSLNAVTARVASMIGMEPIAQTVERFGIMDHMPREYSMALGAGETTPLRHTAAYAMLVNGGKRITPTLDRPHPGPQRRDDLPRRSAPVRWLRRCRVAASAGAGHPGHPRAGRRSRLGLPDRHDDARAWWSAAPARR